MLNFARSFKLYLLLICAFLTLQDVTCARQICFDVPTSAGLSGEVQVAINYNQIRHVVNRRIDRVMREWRIEMRDRFEDRGAILKRHLQNSTLKMQEKLEEIILYNKTADCPSRTDSFPDELCEVRRDDFCYWTYATYSHTLVYSEAEKICKRKNSTVAIIPNVSVYDDVRAALNKRIPGKRAQYVDAWLGSRVDPRSKQITYPDPDIFTSWGYDAPFSGEKNTQMFLFSSPRFYGMRNAPPSAYQSGVVCQI